MSVFINAMPFISEYVKDDIISVQKKVHAVNQCAETLDERIRNYAVWKKQYEILEMEVESFNNKQIHQALNGIYINETNDLLNGYIENYQCLQATIKRSHGYRTNHVYVCYHYRIVGFDEYFKKKFTLYSQYSLLKRFISTLSYCIFENSRNPVNGKYELGFAPKEDENPYVFYESRLPISQAIEITDIRNEMKVTKYLVDGLRILFGSSIREVRGKIVRMFIMNACAKTTIEAMIDNIFLAYVYDLKGIKWGIVEYRPDHMTERHVAWCMHRNGSECTLLEQPCHSSVNCAFYKERKTVNANPARTTFFDD